MVQNSGTNSCTPIWQEVYKNISPIAAVRWIPHTTGLPG